jgi:hypothetical protein
LISTRRKKGGTIVIKSTSSSGVRARFKKRKRVAIKVAFELFVQKDKCYCTFKLDNLVQRGNMIEIVD